MCCEDVHAGLVEPSSGAPGGESEAYGVRNALSQRPRGAFHAFRIPEFRVAGRDGALVAEALEVFNADVESRQVQPAVKEHGAVAGGENEAVTVEPAGLRGADVEQIAEQDGPDFGAPQRQAQVAGCAVVNGIHGKSPRLVGCFLEKVKIHARAI